MSRRYFPNIIITGTPGCGKTSHSELLASILNSNHKKDGEPAFEHLSISDVAKDRKCIESYDEVLDTSVVDEDKLLDLLEVDLEKGGIIVDWHCCEVFPERLIDLVVVLHTDNSLLHQRLSKRGYKDNKIQENLDCEIMDVIGQEARDSYVPEIVIELDSNLVEQMEENTERIAAWVKMWLDQHENGVTNELQGGEEEEDDEEEEEDD